MGTGTVKGSLQLFGIIAAGAGVFGLLEGYGIGETLIAAVILSAFVVAIACPPFLGGRNAGEFQCPLLGYSGHRSDVAECLLLTAG